MPERGLPFNVPSPPSTITGDMYRWCLSIAQWINERPVFSYTSYSGGPNSNLTGATGDLCINIAASAQTARLFIKELGSAKTGWVSVATTGP